MRLRVVAVVPARLGSGRFPGKVIYPYRGKPLLSYLLKEVSKARRIDRLVVATDSREVMDSLEGLGTEVIRTSSRHRTGSDRAAEVMRKIGSDIIINIQADNFGLKAGVLDRTIEKLKREPAVKFATLAHRIKSDSDLFDPNIVKVIVSPDDRALWFSRYPLPYLQNAKKGTRAEQFRFYGHIGVYFFRARGLAEFASWKRSAHEKAESLEQLRILENGEYIRVFRTSLNSVSVNTRRDLKKLDMLYR